jgi:hypothetical protein
MYRAELIDEATLKVVATAYGRNKEEALYKVGFYPIRPGFDANTYRETGTQLSGCGVHSFYAD